MDTQPLPVFLHHASGRGGGGRAAVVLAVVLCLVGSGMLAVSLTTPAASTPEPSAAQPAVGASAAPKRPRVRRTVARSPIVPASISIAGIDVAATVTPVTLDRRRRLRVPPPGKAGWWRQGAKPGATGVAVVVGHVDSRTGPGVFAKLPRVRPGHTVTLSAADGHSVTYRVDEVRTYAKDAFPTRRVYGPTKGAQLRLITCGGEYDRDGSGYRDNVVVFASLVSGS